MLPDHPAADPRTTHSVRPVLSDEDVIAGHPFGRAPGLPMPAAVHHDPRAALRAALLPALHRPPCVVAFSGGRDSSVLLAVASRIAAEEGLDRPVAHTFRYPGDPDAEESKWQEAAMAHLAERRLRPEWTRTEIVDELDLVGPVMEPLLRESGTPLYPPALAPTVVLTRIASGGSLVTGNFGDEVLGNHRAGVLRAVWRRRARGMARSDWSATAFAISPGPLRRRIVARQDGGNAWLRPPARTRVAVLNARADADLPLRWDRSVRAVMATRAATIGWQTRRWIAEQEGCSLVEPFGTPEFVECWARFGGRRGGPTRTGAVRLLSGSLLPQDLVVRRGKAVFNRSRFGPASRRFAQGWDGSGVDHSAVDAERLRQEWLADAPSSATALLLQQAWLARNGSL